jgi:hypothetical protein
MGAFETRGMYECHLWSTEVEFSNREVDLMPFHIHPSVCLHSLIILYQSINSDRILIREGDGKITLRCILQKWSRGVEGMDRGCTKWPVQLLY